MGQINLKVGQDYKIYLPLIFAVVIGVLITAHKEAAHRSKKYRDSIDALLLKVPVVGRFVK